MSADEISSDTRPVQIRRLVICCDGTSNNPHQRRPTNVMKIARGVQPEASDDAAQIVFYDWGVGTRGFMDTVSGGAFGRGLQKNVEDAYRFIVHNYRPGDQIYLFGFSRGAFTARSVAGLIRQCSILKKEHADLIPEGYDIYRDASPPDNGTAIEWRRLNSHPMPVIEFLGVFDTVGALGFPANRAVGTAKYWTGQLLWTSHLGRFIGKNRGSAGGMLGTRTDPTGPRPDAAGRPNRFGRGKHGFHDMRLSRWVRNAYHALAIDERRPVFAPAIWDSAPKQVPAGIAPEQWDGRSGGDEVALTEVNQSIVQSWFPGNHSDVGGNSRVENSSAVLEWMARAAERSGLEFEKQFWERIDSDTRDDQGDRRFGTLGASPAGVWKLAGRVVRDMSGNSGGTECIHPLVDERSSARLPEGLPNYEVKNPGHNLLNTCWQSAEPPTP